MKKQALSLFLAGALALSLFGCSAQPAAESAPQSSPAETAGSSSAGVVEELHLGTTAANDTFTTFVESGAFGKMCYNSFVTAPFWQTGPNGEVEPFLLQIGRSVKTLLPSPVTWRWTRVSPGMMGSP